MFGTVWLGSFSHAFVPYVACCSCSVFPQFSGIRSISAAIMAAVVRYLVNTGLGTVPIGWEGHDSGEGLDWRHMAASEMWCPASASRL